MIRSLFAEKPQCLNNTKVSVINTLQRKASQLRLVVLDINLISHEFLAE